VVTASKSRVVNCSVVHRGEQLSLDESLKGNMSKKIIDEIIEHGKENHVMLTLGSNKLVFAQNERWIIGEYT
jgi:hypothetical protein